jgi:hypothetical protein
LNASCSDARRRQFVEILSRHFPILLRAGAASGLLLVVDAIDEKEAPREAHNRECFSTPSRGQLR